MKGKTPTIHIAIHDNVAYDVLPMTCSAVRALSMASKVLVTV
jgi:hypothetical protein